MRYLIAIMALVALVGCGGGSSTECTFSSLTTPNYNMNGQVWFLDGTTPSNDCPYPVTTFSGAGTISQTDNTITVTGADFAFTGQISGSQIRWGGTIQSGGETLTVECTTVNINGDDIGDTMSFSNVSWSVDYGDGTCSGTASGTFERTS